MEKEWQDTHEYLDRLSSALIYEIERFRSLRTAIDLDDKIDDWNKASMQWDIAECMGDLANVVGCIQGITTMLKHKDKNNDADSKV